jgi:hypothetical protein
LNVLADQKLPVTFTLFRPVGLSELALIFDSGMKEFPPRLPEQPIFYPVLNQTYSRQIAREWNAPSAPHFAGFVTKFDLPPDYINKFPVKIVGSSVHQELWVPAEQLKNFNSNIIGHIQVVDAYFGEDFVGFIPDKFGLAGKNATQQFVCLADTMAYSGMDFICETAANAKTIYLNYPFWASRDFKKLGISDATQQKVLNGIVKLWSERSPNIPLCKGSS